MALFITYGALALFFAIVIVILQRSYVADRDFTDFVVAGRSFGGFYQAMAFLNTGLPGYVYLGTFGFIARAGVIGVSVSTLLAAIAVYLMADRVWTWGSKHNSAPSPTRWRCASAAAAYGSSPHSSASSDSSRG
jgi:solute:Na+ symporter, SSS family